MSYSTGADIGTGLQFSWNSSSFAMEITNVSGDGEEVAVIDATHMGAANSRIKIFGELVDPGTFDVECNLAVDQMSKFRAGSTGTVAITVPWGSTTKQITGGAVVQRRNYAIPLEDKMTCGFTIAWTTTPTYPSS